MTSFGGTSITQRLITFVRPSTLLSMIAAALIISGSGAAPLPALPLMIPVGQTLQQPLHGFVDMHTHPMTNLAFGGKTPNIVRSCIE